MNSKLARFICFGLPIPIIIISLFIGPTEQTGVTTFFQLLWDVVRGNELSAQKSG